MIAITTVDYHTAGEPFRIVTGGIPELGGGPRILGRRAWAAANLDHVRRLLVNEPRGHADMYGCFVTAPEDPGADLGVVFFHNAGYSTACGHGTIALVTWALESGLVNGPEVTVDAPSGRLRTWARVQDGDVLSVRFRNVPAFVLSDGIDTPEGSFAVAYGGAFYAFAEDRVAPSEVVRLIQRGRRIKAAVEATQAVVHPAEPEIAGIYGVIFTDGNRNLTVFADGEVDRSPCGSGTSARLALMHARGELATGEEFVHESVVGTRFRGRVVEEVAGGVITEIEGSAHLTGRHEFILEAGDALGEGFLLR